MIHVERREHLVQRVEMVRERQVRPALVHGAAEAEQVGHEHPVVGGEWVPAGAEDVAGGGDAVQQYRGSIATARDPHGERTGGAACSSAGAPCPDGGRPAMDDRPARRTGGKNRRCHGRRASRAIDHPRPASA